MLPVVILPAARLDLFEQAEYYDSEGGEDVEIALSPIVKPAGAGWPLFLKAGRAFALNIPN